ncbi:HAMP domain-containing histidine kinase, partial [Candidatus Marinimicrobia bacterium MT.SAG.4]
DIHLKKMRECLEEDKNLKGEAVFGDKTVEYWYTPAEGEDAVLLIGRDVADKDEALGELMMSEAELITSSKEINVLQGRERTMKDQLAYAERLAAIGQMGAKIAHELNNPLQIISARAELIAELDDKEKIRELVVDMQEEIQHIINISASYMNLGKQAPAEMKSLDINHLLTDLLKALGILGHIKYLDVTSNFDDPIPTVYCDREKIVQVFRNLIMNAAHSMEKSDLKSLIITTSYHDETSSIVIEVSDTGTGIKKKDLATIFDPYFTTKEEGVGTGIGLVIVRDVVEIEMGGTIKVESTYGEGTTFTISLPAEV